MALTLPTIHLNGTSRESLTRDYMDALAAVRTAINKLQATAPNGRDYYPQGPDATRKAEAEHQTRMAYLEAVRTDLDDILTALDT